MPRRNQAGSETPRASQRLPSMGAAFSLGPASRHYRSVMTSLDAGPSAVVPSQWEDIENMEETADEAIEVSADESDEVNGDAGDATADDGDDSDGNGDES